MTIVRAQTPTVSEPGPASGLLTVEGRLTMADFAKHRRRCRIEVASGEGIACTFDAAQNQAILAALTQQVRVTGEYVRSRRKDPDLRIREIAATEQAGSLGRPIPRQMPYKTDLDALAAAQGHTGPTDLDKLMSADFWPEDEDIDEFVATVRRWRDQG